MKNKYWHMICQLFGKSGHPNVHPPPSIHQHFKSLILVTNLRPSNSKCQSWYHYSNISVSRNATILTLHTSISFEYRNVVLSLCEIPKFVLDKISFILRYSFYFNFLNPLQSYTTYVFIICQNRLFKWSSWT